MLKNLIYNNYVLTKQKEKYFLIKFLEVDVKDLKFHPSTTNKSIIVQAAEFSADIYLPNNALCSNEKIMNLPLLYGVFVLKY